MTGLHLDPSACEVDVEMKPAGNGRSGFVAVALGAVLFAVVLWWGRELDRAGLQIHLGAPPFVGRWRQLWSPASWWAIAVAAALVAWWTPAVESLPWRRLLAASWCLALVWPALLQWSEGWDSLYAELGSRRAYLQTARDVDSPVDFLATFVERLPSYPTHVKGHPPGATLAHWSVDRLGAGRSDVLTASFLGVAALAAPASLVALDRLAGRGPARRAAVFAGLAPAAMWVASSPDAMFMGVLACSVAMGAVAVTSPRSRPAHAAAFGAGVLAGLSLSFSYGAMLLLAPLWSLAVYSLVRGRGQRLFSAAAGLAMIPVVFMAAGFDWWAGFQATRAAYVAGVAHERPDRYFVLANIVVFAVAVGPAAVASVVWLRDRAVWWLVGAALAGVVAADLSGFSKGEVERIWLPAVPFVVLATCAIRGLAARRAWLAAQLGLAVLLATMLDSPW